MLMLCIVLFVSYEQLGHKIGEMKECAGILSPHHPYVGSGSEPTQHSLFYPLSENQQLSVILLASIICSLCGSPISTASFPCLPVI